MTALTILYLTVEALLFLGWTVLAFRILFRLTEIAVQRRGAAGLGPIGMAQTYAVFVDFARGRLLRKDRQRLILATLALMLVIPLGPLFI